MQNRLQNESYFQSQVSGDTISGVKQQKRYIPYSQVQRITIRKIVFPSEKDDLDTAIAGTAKQTLFVPGNNYNLDVVKNERIRIDARLKEEGFYYFAPGVPDHAG